MKAVLDSCVALKWVLVEADSPKAVTLRTQYQQQQHELLSPDVFHVECAHALVRAERKAIFRPGDAAALLGDILSTSPVLFASPPLLARAVEIASTMRCGVYDCLYVALAERESCELGTSDQRMAANLQKRFPFIVLLSSLP
jgi:predicted nucleic acid-binding protein